MNTRRLPVHPDLKELEQQAENLLDAIRRQEPAALADLRHFHPHPPVPSHAGLADAQLTLARSYDVPTWTRLDQACTLIDAIWTMTSTPYVQW